MSQGTGDRRVVTYVPRRDRWITVVLWSTALLLAWSAARMATAPMDATLKLGIGAFYAAIIAMCVAPIYALSYRLSDRTLRAGVGPVGRSVALADIESVTPGMKTGLTWGWSLSVKGVVITRRGRRWKVFVSPLCQGDFLRDLAERCPHLELRDGALSRTDAS